MATATYISGTSFSISGNMIAEFCVGRAIRCDCGTAGMFTGYITSSSYSSSTGKTTVIVSLDSGVLTSQLSSVSHGNDVPTSMCRATQTSVGAVTLATSAISVAGVDTTKSITPATQRQAVLSWCRDSLGKFPGIMPPSLNLFCGDATSDTAPTGTFTRSTTGTRLGQAGVVETVASGSVRREWGASGELKGWKVEESRTNMLMYSEQINTSTWTKSNCSIAADSTVAPDGTTTADKIVENSTDSVLHYVNTDKSFTLSSGTTTFSIFAKAGERSILYIYIVDSTGILSSSTTTINLSTGTITSGSNAKIISIGNGWYRVAITVSAASGVFYGRCFLNNGTTITYTGDGSSGLYLWGAQVEAGPFASSYIPTTTAATARSADVWTVPLAASWFNAASGTAFVAGRTAHGAPATGGYQVLVQFDDGTSNNRMVIVRDGGRGIYCIVSVSGSQIATMHLGSVADATTFRVACSWSASRFSASLNGGSCVTATAAPFSTSLTVHNIGSGVFGNYQWGGHVLHDVYFPVALSDAQLQAITL